MKSLTMIRSRVSLAFAAAMVAVVMSPEASWASTVGRGDASTYFPFLNRIMNMFGGILPTVSLLAIVGGIVAFGLTGQKEGFIKHLGPAIGTLGLGAMILSAGNFVGIGAACL
jgi:hypothetical protein